MTMILCLIRANVSPYSIGCCSRYYIYVGNLYLHIYVFIYLASFYKCNVLQWRLFYSSISCIIARRFLSFVWLNQCIDDFTNDSLLIDALSSIPSFQNLGRVNAGNVLLSPISIKLALTLLYEGAQDQTARELAGAMQLPVNVLGTREKLNNILKSLQVKNLLHLHSILWAMNRIVVIVDKTTIGGNFYTFVLLSKLSFIMNMQNTRTYIVRYIYRLHLPRIP